MTDQKNPYFVNSLWHWIANQERELTIYGTAKPHAKCANKNAMALLGQIRDSWPSMAPLGNVELTKAPKLFIFIFVSVFVFLFSFLFLYLFLFMFSFSFLFLFLLSFSFLILFLFLFMFLFMFLLLLLFYFFVFLLIFFFSYILSLNVTMAPSGHHKPAILLKKDSSAGVLLWIFQNVLGKLFFTTYLGGCLWD